MTIGPRMAISPSTILISTPGKARPTVSRCASSGVLMVAAALVSVRPYAWRIVKPSEYRSRPITGSNFEPPVTNSRMSRPIDVVDLAEEQPAEVDADAPQPEVRRRAAA